MKPRRPLVFENGCQALIFNKVERFRAKNVYKNFYRVKKKKKGTCVLQMQRDNFRVIVSSRAIFPDTQAALLNRHEHRFSAPALKPHVATPLLDSKPRRIPEYRIFPPADSI